MFWGILSHTLERRHDGLFFWGVRREDLYYNCAVMAKKTRKAGKAAVSQPSPVSPSRSSPPPSSGTGLVALGALALVASWLAALGALAAGDLELRDVFEFDTLRPWLMYADMTGDQFPVTGWRQGVTYFWVPDVAILLPLFATGLDFRAVMLLFPLIQVALCAAGWILVCDFLFGKSPARRAAVLLLHALTFLVLAWRGADIFYFQMNVVYHYGTWATVPWLLWLSLRVLRERPRRASRPDAIAAAALVILLALSTASDLLIVIWFIVPAGAAAAVMTARGKLPAREAAWFLGMLAAGYVAGKFLADLQPFPPNRNTEAFTSFNPAKTMTALGNMLDNFILVARRNTLETLLWLAFAGAGAWRGLTVMFGGGRRAGRSRLELAFGVPEGRGHCLVALFVPAAALAPLLAVAATGNFFAPQELFWRLGQNRYFASLYFIALFVGWALLPWGGVGGIGEKLRGLAGFKLTPSAAGVWAGAALVVLFSAPRAAETDADHLDPFNTPFQQCFAENAKRLNWKGGIATAPLALHLRADPNAEIERMLLVVNWSAFARNPGESALLVDWLQINRRWFSGDFQFVAVNDFKGRVYRDPPGRGHSGCAHAERRECGSATDEGFFLGEEAVRAALGEPAEVVECDGIGFLHYDPPLNFNLGDVDNPDLKVVGRRW